MDRYRVKKEGSIKYGQCTIKMVKDMPWESDGRPRNGSIRVKRANFTVDFDMKDFLDYFKKWESEE